MSAGHAHALYIHGDSFAHCLAPQTKVAALFLFVLAVVATPRHHFWAFAVYAALLVTAAVSAGLPARRTALRLLIEVPFLLFALLLPFIGGGERTTVLGLSLSEAGLWGAWTILAKGTLGVGASIILAATTQVGDILKGLDRLHVPRVITAIAGFMIRYLDIVADEMRRSRIAMLSRGYDPRWWWQAKALAASVGTLFIRAYERGERVYQSMTARGYQGQMPELGGPTAAASDWLTALALPAAAWATAVAALWWVG